MLTFERRESGSFYIHLASRLVITGDQHTPPVCIQPSVKALRVNKEIRSGLALIYDLRFMISVSDGKFNRADGEN